MRPFVRDFVAEVAAAMTLEEPIVEIGSRPAEGQEEIADLRRLFPGRPYFGCDIQDGVGVDQVEDIHALSFGAGTVGTVLCLDTLEHVADPLTAMREVHRVLKPGGTAVISSHMFMPIHAHPWDYWRFTPEGFGLVLAPFESRLVLAHGWALMPDTVLGIGVKGPGRLEATMFPRTTGRIESWGQDGSVDLGPIRFGTRQAWKFALAATQSSVRARIGRRRRHA
jgi:SAM-dependent methyltransferase